MRKVFCDKCKREIEDTELLRERELYGKYAYGIDLCPECSEAWDKRRKEIRDKYDQEYERLAKEERKEVEDWLGFKAENIGEYEL